jgi:uncharacterized protein (DUF169 family)
MAFGWPWIPVKFLTEAPSSAAQQKRFCESIPDGQVSPVILTAESITCPGAKRSFGWARGMDEGLAEKLSINQGVTLGTAKKALKRVPHLDDGVVAVEVGTRSTPDVLVSFAQPPTLMKLARAYEKTWDEPIRPVLSSILSVCGNAAVRSHMTSDVTVSMGCDASRESGQIGRDRLVIGVPWDRVAKLADAAD